MNSLLEGAHSFQQPLADWNSGRVTDMSRMLADLPNFNQDVSGLDTSSVQQMRGMFFNATKFQGTGLNTFQTGRVLDMKDMFSRNYALESPDLSGWDVSSLRRMRGMFSYCYSLNTESLENWNTQALVDMGYTFVYAESFGASLAGWNVAQVTSMEGKSLLPKRPRPAQ